jgi:hypothetical protein
VRLSNEIGGRATPTYLIARLVIVVFVGVPRPQGCFFACDVYVCGRTAPTKHGWRCKGSANLGATRPLVCFFVCNFFICGRRTPTQPPVEAANLSLNFPKINLLYFNFNRITFRLLGIFTRSVKPPEKRMK